MARRLNTRLLVRLLVFVGVPVAAIVIVATSGWLRSGDPQPYIEEAKALVETGDWAPAWVAVRNAMKAGAAGDPDVQMLAGRIALKQTPPARGPALQAFRAAVALKPDFVEAQELVVQLYLGAGYWKEARAEADRLIQIAPALGDAYVWAATVEMGAAEAEPTQARKAPFYEVAVTRCRAGIDKAPDALGLYVQMAQAYDRLDRIDKDKNYKKEADAAVDLAVTNNPTVADAYILKAGRLLAANKADEAADVLKAGLQAAGESARLYIVLGEVAQGRKDPDQARDFLAKALALDPKNESIYLRLSSMHRSDNDRDKALAVITQGLEQLPESKALKVEQADLFLEQGNLAGADAIITARAAEEPDAPVVSYLRGKRAFLNRQTRQAITYLEQARDRQDAMVAEMRAKPDTRAAALAAAEQVLRGFRLLLARAYLVAEELGAAQRELSTLLAEQPGLVGAWRTLADVQFRLHDYERAARSAKAVLDANPDDTRMRLLMAQTLVLRNRPAEALKEAQAAADRDKNSPDPLLLMADIYGDMKRPADAEAMYRRALTLGQNTLSVARLFVQYLKATNQQGKLDALARELRKTLTEEEVIELVGGPAEVERVLAARAEKADAPASASLALARLYYYTDRADQAKEMLRKALTTAKPGSPDWRQAWQQLFTLELSGDAYDKAVELVDQIKKVDPQAPELLFAEPLLALSQNKVDQAVSQLRAVCDANKTLSQAHFVLGQVLARTRQWDEAVAAMTRALELRPQLVPARLFLARIYLAQGNYTAVLAETGEALKFDPGLVAALDLKAMAHAGLGAWDQAAAAREEIARVVPKNINNLVVLGALAFHRHQPEKAEEIFTQAYRQSSDNLAEAMKAMQAALDDKARPALLAYLERHKQILRVVVGALADFYIDTNRAAQGEKIVDEYVGRYKDDPQAYLLRGAFTARTAGPAEAEKYFRKAAELAPDDPSPLVLLADRFGLVGEWEKAEAVYLQAIQRAPKNMAVKQRLAEVYLLQGKLKEAKATIDEVLQADPKDASVLVIAGRIASRLDKADEAQRYMAAALAIAPRYGEAKVRLAELYAGPDPLKALDLLAGIDPSDAAFERAMLLRADINTRRILLPEAVLDLRRLLDFRPTSVPGRLALASKYRAMREPGRAAELLQQLSRERMDKDPFFLVALGDALEIQQRYADALANYEKARALKPEYAEALVGEVRCLVAMNRTTEAETRVRDVMNKYTKEVWPRVALVALYLKIKQPDKAFDAVRTGLINRPDWEQGYVMLAELLAQDNKPADARQVLAAGLANIPKSILLRAAVATREVNDNRPEAARKILQPLAEEFQALYSRTPEKLDKLKPYMVPIRIYSLALFNLGQTDEAVKWGMMLWSLDPTDVANANNMAWVWATTYKDYGRATEMIQQCMRLLPNHPQVLDTAGWIAFLSGKHQEAADNLLASIKYGDNPEAHYHLGRVYEARERFDEARAEYQKALQMGLQVKDREDAQRRLAQLKK
ncbi:MAG: tetratricopeptide repeat protein [Planctomycetes bacterium]|nr:tetratricopeptide repeat protein [Planctomycetota bacterium]